MALIGMRVACATVFKPRKARNSGVGCPRFIPMDTRFYFLLAWAVLILTVYCWAAAEPVAAMVR